MPVECSLRSQKNPHIPPGPFTHPSNRPKTLFPPADGSEPTSARKVLKSPRRKIADMSRRPKRLQLFLHERRPKAISHRLRPELRSKRLARKQEKNSIHPSRQIWHAN